MITASLADGMSTTDIILLVGLVGIAIKTAVESMGWTPTNKLLREENQALLDRNKTIEEEKAMLVLGVAEGKANELKLLARIESLELKVRELETRDQAAVLAAITAHEAGAVLRYDSTRDGDERRHAEHVTYLERIVVALESPDFQTHLNQGGVL